MRRLCGILALLAGILALLALTAGCGSSAHPAVTAESSTTTEVGTTTTAQAGTTGPTGPTGPTGAAGAPGTPGGPGISGYEIVTNSKSASASLPGGSSIDVSAACPPGKSILSGGASETRDPEIDHNGQSVYPYLERSMQTDASTWTARTFWRESIQGPQTITLTVTIACAVVG